MPFSGSYLLIKWGRRTGWIIELYITYKVCYMSNSQSTKLVQIQRTKQEGLQMDEGEALLIEAVRHFGRRVSELGFEGCVGG